uniref:Uncharacterized protein n=1 Tax=Anguilla anguilla TaxID=7936 RepID=A0A0E9SVQ5_ANGAN
METYWMVTGLFKIWPNSMSHFLNLII